MLTFLNEQIAHSSLIEKSMVSVIFIHIYYNSFGNILTNTIFKL